MWNPDPRLHYSGKYPTFELVKARQTLIASLQDTRSEVLERLKPRIGIPSRFGPPVPFLPPSFPPTRDQGEKEENMCLISSDDMVLKKRRLTNSSSVPASTVTREESPRSKVSTSSSTNSKDSKTAKEDSVSKTLKEKDAANGAEAKGSDAAKSDVGRSSVSRKDDAVIATVVNQNVKHTKDDVIKDATSKNVIDLTEDTDADDSDDDGTEGGGFGMGVGSFDITQLETERLVTIYKCDHCQFKTNTGTYGKLEEHLRNTLHYSASLCKARELSDGQMQLVYVEEKLAVTKKENQYEAMVVVCPSCGNIYQDIYMCADHSSWAHGLERGVYSVCPVLFRDTVFVRNNPTCRVCQIPFLTFRELHDHWRKQKLHHPVRRPLPENAFALYICSLCNLTFQGSYFDCENHVIGKHATSPAGAVKVRYVQKALRSETIMLSKEEINGGGDVAKINISTLTRMKKHLNKIGGTSKRLQKRKIKAQIKQLRKFSAN